jgi:metal-responsive CopG/Arc/MetJ family transcriptional regulator
MSVKVKIGFTIEPELLKEIEELRGIIKRSTFIEYIIKLGLKSYMEENTVAPHMIKRAGKRKAGEADR